jgi:glycosyltransferase involved in cell wall biosynthesis
MSAVVHALGRLLPSGAAGFDFAALGVSTQQVLELLVDLEDELEIAFEERDLTPENLRSPSALAALAEARVAALPRRKSARYVHVLSEFLPHVSGPARNVQAVCEQLGDSLDFEVYTFDLDRGLPAHDVQAGLAVSRFAVPRFVDLMRLRRRAARLTAAEEDGNYGIPSSQIFHALQADSADGIVSWFYSGILAHDLVELFPSRRWLLIPSFFQPPGPRFGSPAYWDPERVQRMLLFQEADYRRALEWGMPRDKVVLAPCPVDTEVFRPLGLERDEDTLLYVGRLTPNKGLVPFLETFQAMLLQRPSLRLRIIADLASPAPIERREVERLRRKIAALELTDRVELAGRRDGEALVREFASHRIHVLPSIADFYSTVTAEALACGMTCVNLELPSYEWQRRRDGSEPLVHLCPTLPEMGRTILRLLAAGELPDHCDYMQRHLSWEAHRDVYRDFFD